MAVKLNRNMQQNVFEQFEELAGEMLKHLVKMRGLTMV